MRKKKTVQQQEDEQTEKNTGEGVELTWCLVASLFPAVESRSFALRLCQGLTGSSAPAVKQREKREEECNSIGFLYWLGQGGA